MNHNELCRVGLTLCSLTIYDGFLLAQQNEEPPFKSKACRGLGGSDASHGANGSRCCSANRVPARESFLLL